ncbi:MAG: hypothetical protein A7316_09855 [Candidatus Altiarchaeales archaeon WOR_SM1_86-2]|nr:MAG: hypothetical protein A7316_09855 [Candidatus Altiarchaeales archaeon WOR_SM1_86-2]
MKSPCELVVWYLLPAIRSEVAKALDGENILQKDTARHLGMTPSAVSLYISGKRGSDIELPGEIKLKISELAKRIITEDMSPVDIMKGICTICVEARKKKILCDLHRKVDEGISDECDFWGEGGECI